METVVAFATNPVHDPPRLYILGGLREIENAIYITDLPCSV